jgi:hypothetical protein
MLRAGSLPRSVGGLVLTLAAIAALVFANPAAGQEQEGLIPEGDWTEDQIQFMLDLIDETERVLPERFPTVATYEELEAALIPMGFFEFGVSAPGGYDHWINPGWLFDDHLIDPEFSESLVYQEQADGTWRLVSAMFMLEPDIDMDSIPEDIAWLPGWHGHPELCVAGDGTFAGVTDPENPDCPEGTSQAETPLMMHVWIEDNECNHRFGGVGVGGLHCEHEGHAAGMDDGSMDGMDGMDDGSDSEPPQAQPAQPIVAEPSFTG